MKSCSCGRGFGMQRSRLNLSKETWLRLCMTPSFCGACCSACRPSSSLPNTSRSADLNRSPNLNGRGPQIAFLHPQTEPGPVHIWIHETADFRLRPHGSSQLILSWSCRIPASKTHHETDADCITLMSTTAVYKWKSSFIWGSLNIKPF